MNTVALKEKDMQADKIVQEHHALAMEVLRCINGLGKTAKPRISLFIEKAGDDGKDDTGRV